MGKKCFEGYELSDMQKQDNLKKFFTLEKM